MIYVPPPGPPLNLTATTSPGQNSLSWSAAAAQPGTTIARYVIYRNDSGNWPPIGTATATSFIDTAVQPLVSYSYYVVAVDSRGAVSIPSNQVSIVTSGPLPLAPTGLTVNGTTSSSATLSWNAVGGSTYNLYRNGVNVASGLLTTSTTDSGLNPSTTYSYRVSATNVIGEGPQSSAVNATTSAASTGGMVWIPGHIGRTGSGNSSGFAGQLPTVLSFIQSAVTADINNQLVGFCVPALWANLEGPTAGVYDGSWAGSQAANSGFAGVQQLINLLKSFTPKRYLMLSLNQTGNGAGANTNTAFPSGFAPAYLGVGGSGNIYEGGCEWGGRSGYTGYPNTNTTLWNINTALRVATMVKAYYSRFGPYDPVTGNGIYMWELTNEIGLQTTSALNNPDLVNAIINGYGTIRTGVNAAPDLMLCMRPTFVHPETPAGYNAICNAMFNAKISMANEDGSNNPLVANGSLTAAKANPRIDWGDLAYAGRNPGTGVPDGTMIDYTQRNTWAHIFNVENAEFGRENAPLGAVPPAGVGSGYILNNPSFPGIMSGAAALNSSHIIWFLDTQDGPNVNRFKFPVTTGQAPNPTPGPGAGLTTSRPHLIDVITGNASADPTHGITGPVPIPRTTKPTGW